MNCFSTFGSFEVRKVETCLRRLISLGILAVAILVMSQAKAATFAPGVYGPFGNGVQQWSTSLQTVNTFNLGPSGGMTGAAFSSDGLFLTQFYDTNPGGGPELLALGSLGQIVRKLPLSDGLYSGSGIVILPGSGNILMALDTHILDITPNFSSVTTLPLTFGRIAGLALGGDGTLYAVDSNANQIDVINPSLTGIVTTIPTHQTPIGLAKGPDNAIYYTDEPYVGGTFLSRMVRVDLANNYSQSVIQSGLPFLSGLTFGQDGSYYLGEANGRSLAHYSFDGTLLQLVSSPGLTDGVAVIPEPVSLALMPTVVLLLLGRRRGQ